MVVKKSVKRALEGLLSKDPIVSYEELKRAVDSHDLISFDVFDTLIKRNVGDPHDVFDLVAKLYSSRGYGDFSSFHIARCCAEVSARGESKCEEVTLDEIYEQLDVEEDCRRVLKALEVEVELDVCVACLPMKAVFEYAVAQGKRVVIVSDMYLSAAVIAKILDRAGYSGYSNLYVSSEYNATKASGTLYALVKKEEGIDGDRCLHIGDSIRADYLKCKSAGFDSFLISRDYGNVLPKRYCVPSRDMASVYSVARNIVGPEKDFYWRFGAEVFGPVLFGFCRMIKAVAERENADSIFFLSRDGYLVKRAFDAMYPDFNGKESYLHVSRRALRLPCCRCGKDLEAVLPNTKYVTFSSVLDALGIDRLRRGSFSTGLSLDTVLEDAHMLSEIGEYATTWEVLKAEALSAARRECDAAVRYFESSDLLGKCLVVDIGWHGSLQRSLERILGEAGIDARLFGCYLGLDVPNDELDFKAEGYLGEYFPGAFLGLVETCFLAHEGSTKRYVATDDGKVIAELYPYEYGDISTDEESNESELVGQIQNGAVAFVAEYSRFDSKYDCDIKPSALFEPLRCYGLKPTLEEVDRFGFFRFMDDGSTVMLANPDSLVHYLLHPGLFKKDLFSSRWKVGFCKKLFKIPFPYDVVYGVLKGDC